MLVAGLAALGAARADELVSLGASSCSSSGCHGGAGEKSDQFGVWAQRDVHSRSYATLTTARSARMAEALTITDPAVSPRCVVCHAPLAEVAPSRLGAGVDPAEGAIEKVERGEAPRLRHRPGEERERRGPAGPLAGAPI